MKISPRSGLILVDTKVHGPATAVRGVVFNYIEVKFKTSLQERGGFNFDPSGRFQ